MSASAFLKSSDKQKKERRWVQFCIVFQFTMFSTQYTQHVSFPSSKLQIIAVAMDVPQVWVVHSWLRWDLLCNEATIEQFEQIIK